MKVKARFLILILFTNSISDGTASFKCMSGYKMTQDNEEKVEEFSEKDCNPDVGYDRCYSAKGSLVVKGVKYEVAEVRGCTAEEICTTATNALKTDTFGNSLRQFLNGRKDVSIKIMAAAETGTTIPSDVSCCDTSSCEVSIVKPAESNSGRLMKKYWMIVVAGLAYKFFV